MKINQEKLSEYIKNLHSPVCPFCGKNDWTVSDQIFQLPEFSYKGLLVGGAMFPVLPITCTTCGNAYFINALVANLIDKKEQSEDIAEDKSTNDN